MRYRPTPGWPDAARRGLWRVGGVVRLALLATLLATSVEVAGQEPAESSAPLLQDRYEHILVGALIGTRETETFEVVREGDSFYVPVTGLLSICGCELEARAEGEFVLTPLGATKLLDADLLVLDDVRFVHERFLRRAMGTDVEFVQELYALRFYFPWSPGEALRSDAVGTAASPPADYLPPSLSLSSLRVDGRYSRRPESTLTQVSSLLHGRMADGRWRLRVDENFAGSTNLQEYAWTRTYGQKLVLAGHQRVSLHPLLGSLEMTGIHGAWTNQPLEMFLPNAQPSELLPRNLVSSATIAGRGPAAGVAELRIEGVAVARQTISLDGTYEFLDVQLPSRQSTQLEVYVYDRFDRSAPLEIHDHTRGVSDQMLPAGAMVMMGGAGGGGNLLADGNHFGTAAGFVQSRIGLSDAMTVEAAVQTRDGRQQAVAGVVGTLGSHLVGSASLGASGSAFAWDLDVQGYFDKVRVTARSQQAGEGFHSAASGARFYHYGEVAYRPTDNLDLGLIATSRLAGTLETTFVLPTVSWQPTSRTWLKARPDLLGRYRVDFSWTFAARSRVTAAYLNHALSVGVSSALGRSVQLAVLGEWSADTGNRQTTQVSWVGSGALQPGLTGAVRRTRGLLGIMLGGQVTVGPGVLASAQFENDPRLNDPLNRRDPRLTLRLFTDLAFARGRVLAGNSYSLSSTRGAIGGRLELPPNSGLDPADLAGLPVLIDGRAVTRTERGGRFFVGNLRPGTYRVQIDPQGMPIELRLDDSSHRARVEPGAVTAVHFRVDIEYGFAGRVSVEEQFYRDALVEVLDAAGEVIATARTDRFGLYRIDAVPRGTYTVRLSPSNAPGAEVVWPSVVVTIDDYGFGVDLALRMADIRESGFPAGLDAGRQDSQAGEGPGSPAGGRFRPR